MNNCVVFQNSPRPRKINNQFIATFRVARLTLQTGKLWLVSRPTVALATLACVSCHFIFPVFFLLAFLLILFFLVFFFSGTKKSPPQKKHQKEKTNPSKKSKIQKKTRKKKEALPPSPSFSPRRLKKLICSWLTWRSMQRERGEKTKKKSCWLSRASVAGTSRSTTASSETDWVTGGKRDLFWNIIFGCPGAGCRR